MANYVNTYSTLQTQTLHATVSAVLMMRFELKVKSLYSRLSMLLASVWIIHRMFMSSSRLWNEMTFSRGTF